MPKSKTRIYRIYRNMLKRCFFEKYEHFHRYGGRGITVDKKWLSFEGFFEDMHLGYDDNMTLDRIDNDGNYCKENCKWSTMKEQTLNRSSNRILSLDGVSMTLKEWSDKTGIRQTTITQRIDYGGWSVRKALSMKNFYKPNLV